VARAGHSAREEYVVATINGLLQTEGNRFVDGDGVPIRLRGVGLGGWMNMENFVTGYSANESLMRSTVREVLGDDRYELFFDRLLTVFFGDGDARLLAELGMNCVRIPVNYRHFERDSRPFEFLEDGFRQLDRAIEACARHGLRTVIDLHALPGAQNQHWHSDNYTHRAMFWDHVHFQDRAVALWEVIADRYKGDPRIAGYNPINEPADESRAAVRTVYKRLVNAIRAIDRDHILFLDGNTYSTEFDVFDNHLDNVVYACHDYAAPGFIRGGDYPGITNGVFVDKAALEEKYRQRTEYSRKTDSPVWVGEFGPVYTGDERRDAMRYQILADQLEIYADDLASWSIWTYKDIGCQGIAVVRPDSAYRSRFGDFVAKKNRLGADLWDSDGSDIWPVSEQFQAKLAQEFPDFSPYPWGRWDWARTLLLNITVAQPLAYEYAELFRGLGDDDVLALADSFDLANCDLRHPLIERLRADLSGERVP
jgi:endoglucanase